MLREGAPAETQNSNPPPDKGHCEFYVICSILVDVAVRSFLSPRIWGCSEACWMERGNQLGTKN